MRLLSYLFFLQVKEKSEKFIAKEFRLDNKFEAEKDGNRERIKRELSLL